MRSSKVEPAAHVAFARLQVQQLHNFVVEAFLGQRHRHAVDRVHILHRDDMRFRHIAEQRDFLFQILRQPAVAAAQQQIGLNSDRKQFLHGMLRRLGFQFTGSGNKRHQRHVHQQRIFRPQLEPHLADRFQKRQRFDIAHRAADFDDHYIRIAGNLAERSL